MGAQPIRVIGLPELLRRLDAPKLVGPPARRFLTKWGTFVEREGKRNAPVWRGLLRRSLTHEVDGGAFPTRARAGTNIEYGPAMEYGTGLLSEAPDRTGGRHHPSAAQLAPWAKSKGADPYVVANAIARRGGLRPRRYLRTAAEASGPRIAAWLTDMAGDIEQEAGRAR